MEETEADAIPLYTPSRPPSLGHRTRHLHIASVRNRAKGRRDAPDVPLSPGARGRVLMRSRKLERGLKGCPSTWTPLLTFRAGRV